MSQPQQNKDIDKESFYVRQSKNICLHLILSSSWILLIVCVGKCLRLFMPVADGFLNFLACFHQKYFFVFTIY
jgi:hypothetical protein